MESMGSFTLLDISRPRSYPNINNEDLSDSVEDIAHQACPQLPSRNRTQVGKFKKKILEGLMRQRSNNGVLLLILSHLIAVSPDICRNPEKKENLDTTPQDTYLTGTANKRAKDLSKAVLSAELGVQEVFTSGEDLFYVLGINKKMIKSRGSGLQAVKPVMIDQYNKYMGGIDLKDRPLYHLTCSRATRRYWKKIFYHILDMALFNSYILLYMMALVEQLSRKPARQPSPQPPQASSRTQHKLAHLPGVQKRVCSICGKRSPWWCPQCNCGVHPKCFSNMKHFRRTLKGTKKQHVMADASDSE
ncbi:hypothetical protein J6590_048200 [Homalodisca vitripennis]|nr:hypothetical protein J6590_048200 [Homalodisca vitripennis]